MTGSWIFSWSSFSGVLVQHINNPLIIFVCGVYLVVACVLCFYATRVVIFATSPISLFSLGLALSSL